MLQVPMESELGSCFQPQGNNDQTLRACSGSVAALTTATSDLPSNSLRRSTAQRTAGLAVFAHIWAWGHQRQTGCSTHPKVNTVQMFDSQSTYREDHSHQQLVHMRCRNWPATILRSWSRRLPDEKGLEKLLCRSFQIKLQVAIRKMWFSTALQITNEATFKQDPSKSFLQKTVCWIIRLPCQKKTGRA